MHPTGSHSDDGDIQREKSKDPSSVRSLIYTSKWWMISEHIILLSLATDFPKTEARIPDFTDVGV